jgi:hypothetical protein
MLLVAVLLLLPGRRGWVRRVLLLGWAVHRVLGMWVVGMVGAACVVATCGCGSSCSSAPLLLLVTLRLLMLLMLL